MACQKCKKKTQLKEAFNNSSKLVGEKVVLLLVVLILLATYGLYSLILNFI